MNDLTEVAEEREPGHLRSVAVMVVGVPVRIARMAVAGAQRGCEQRMAVIDDARQGQIRVKLKYSTSGDKVIHVIDRYSKPGCRVYRKVEELPNVLNGMGIAVVSTSKGVMSDRKAREQNVGGELLCVVS